MALSPKNLATGGVVTALGGGAVAGGVILSTRGEKIENLVRENLLVTIADFEGRLNSKKSDEQPPKSIASELKTWCEQNLQTRIKEGDQELVELLNKFKKWCTFTIKQKLGNKVLRTDTATNSNDSSDWKIKSKNLKDYEQVSEDISLNLDSLKEVKKNIETSTDDNKSWEHLRNWCESTYSKNYQEENNLWKLSKKFCTKATIKDALHGTELPTGTDFSGDWDKKVTAAKSTSDSSGMKDVSTRNKLQPSTQETTRKELQTWCETQYLKTHDSQEEWNTSTPKNVSVLEEVKKWCSLTIKEKMNENDQDNDKPQDENSSSDTWKTNAKKLNDYVSDSDKVDLTTELKSMKKTSDTDGSQNKDEIKNWCKKTYEKGYKGSNDQLYKLASYLCSKKTS